jgi:carboxyl-terminal processing protease
VLENVDGAASVLAVMLKSPADKAGIQPGDRLTLVDDTTVAGLDARTLELRLAGDKGSKVHLRFERAPRLEPDTFSVTLKRDYLKVPSVSIVRLADPDAAGHAGCPRELDECPRGVGYGS